MHLFSSPAVAVVVSSCLSCIANAAVPTYSANPERAAAVKEAFQRSWDGYYKYAFPHDSLRPVTNTFEDDRNGWGASAVDALSTALIMENAEVAQQILEFIPTINFNVTTTEVSLFETTIRYLGGLVSAYDLITGPFKDIAPNATLADEVLKQAKRLADNLKVAFDTPSGVPDNSLFFDPAPRKAGNVDNYLATVGTLVLEWTRLSDLIGDNEYANLTQRAESYLLDPHPAIGEPWPGLVGSRVYVDNGTFADGSGGWVGGTDSFYEYLIKMWIYDPKKFSLYKERWIIAVDSSIKYLSSHPTSRPDLTFLAAYFDGVPWFVSGHLACFDGGNIILGGLVLKEQKYIDYGIELAKGCHETYTQTTTGIGPELFQWQDDKVPANATNNPPPPKEQAEFYEKAGFWVVNGQYVLRPEVIESYYYAYRATGDKKYQDWAWEAFLRINETCSVGSGFSAITDVTVEKGGQFFDFQESFWFAEVLKYSYLIQAKESDVQVQVEGNKFVYNTEAHPVKIAD